jgi:hypothetical protein
MAHTDKRSIELSTQKPNPPQPDKDIEELANMLPRIFWDGFNKWHEAGKDYPFIDRAREILAKLRTLGYRSPSEIRAIERDAVERVFGALEKIAGIYETETRWSSIGEAGLNYFKRKLTDKSADTIIFTVEEWLALKSELLGEQDKGG